MSGASHRYRRRPAGDGRGLGTGLVPLRADEKYTVVARRDERGRSREAVIRIPLKELAAQLDISQFAQVHRAVVVNLSSIARIVRGANETADIYLKGRAEVLPVSRNYLHLFRQM